MKFSYASVNLDERHLNYDLTLFDTVKDALVAIMAECRENAAMDRPDEDAIFTVAFIDSEVPEANPQSTEVPYREDLPVDFEPEPWKERPMEWGGPKAGSKPLQAALRCSAHYVIASASELRKELGVEAGYLFGFHGATGNPYLPGSDAPGAGKASVL